jgi:hypothetical protein
VIICDYADVFDGAMIVLAMYTLNIFHPSIYLPVQAEYHPAQTASSESINLEERLKLTQNQDKAV